MIEQVEISIKTGRPLFMSRKYSDSINPLAMKDAGYCLTKKVGDEIHYVWNDQFPIPIIWQGTRKQVVYEPGDVLHKQNIKKRGA
jgi:hypothetical protein